MPASSNSEKIVIYSKKIIIMVTVLSYKKWDIVNLIFLPWMWQLVSCEAVALKGLMKMMFSLIVYA